MRGLTIPRPVKVKTIAHIGKEVLVDPSDTNEELTAEELNATVNRFATEARQPISYPGVSQSR